MTDRKDCVLYFGYGITYNIIRLVMANAFAIVFHVKASALIAKLVVFTYFSIRIIIIYYYHYIIILLYHYYYYFNKYFFSIKNAVHNESPEYCYNVIKTEIYCYVQMYIVYVKINPVILIHIRCNERYNYTLNILLVHFCIEKSVQNNSVPK